MENSLITLYDIRKVNPELRTITSVKQNKRFIFKLFIKEAYDDIYKVVQKVLKATSIEQ